MIDVLWEDRIPFVDLNNDQWFTTPNLGASHKTAEPDSTRHIKEGRLDRVDAQDEDSSLGRRYLIDEESFRRHAGDVLWLAQKRPSSKRDR